MIVDAALPPFVTVNLIMSAVPVTQPVTAPVVSVAPAAGIATFVTPPTGVALPTSNTAVGAVAGAATFTATVLDAGVIVNPAGFAIATVTFAPFATVIAEIASVRVVPVPANVPFVAPVTVMSPTAKVVGSRLKVRVNSVVVVTADVPFAVKLEKVTATAVAATGVIVTVTTRVAVLLPSTVVTVIIVVPAVKGVTTPLTDTVATAGALEDQVTLLLVVVAGATVATNVPVAPPAVKVMVA